jgi:hypothetical protein
LDWTTSGLSGGGILCDGGACDSYAGWELKGDWDDIARSAICTDEHRFNRECLEGIGVDEVCAAVSDVDSGAIAVLRVNAAEKKCGAKKDDGGDD